MTFRDKQDFCFEHQRHEPSITIGRAGKLAIAISMDRVLVCTGALFLGATFHISTNIAAVPFLWVVPLAIYLLSFVLVFSRRPPIPHKWMVVSLPIVLILLTVNFWSDDFWRLLFLHLAAVFVGAMVCHGELRNRRPVTGHLTEFYLWIAIGGLLGGIFNSILAPLIFDTALEYPLIIVLLCLLRPHKGENSRLRIWLDIFLPIWLIALFLLPQFTSFDPSAYGSSGERIFIILIGLALISFQNRPVRLGLGLAGVLLTSNIALVGEGVLETKRTFFGIYRVDAVATEVAPGEKPETFHVLLHGTTRHGAQNIEKFDEPLTYYHRTGPLGQLLALMADGDRQSNIGAIGLGAGSIACYQQPESHTTFFEIDPAVEEIARDPRLFSFLEKCGQNIDVIIGDGRLALSRSADKIFDLLIIDAFTSDAIPTHLLTREALSLYLRKLTNRGVIALHISNTYLDLEPVVAGTINDLGV